MQQYVTLSGVSLDRQMSSLVVESRRNQLMSCTPRASSLLHFSLGAVVGENTYHDFDDIQNRLTSLSLEVEERNTVVAEASLCLHTLLSVFCF